MTDNQSAFIFDLFTDTGNAKKKQASSGHACAGSGTEFVQLVPVEHLGVLSYWQIKREWMSAPLVGGPLGPNVVDKFYHRLRNMIQLKQRFRQGFLVKVQENQLWIRTVIIYLVHILFKSPTILGVRIRDPSWGPWQGFIWWGSYPQCFSDNSSSVTYLTVQSHCTQSALRWWRVCIFQNVI